MTVVVRPLENYVWFSLQQKDSDFQLIEFALFVCAKVRTINDKRGEYLRFETCLVAPSKYSRLATERIWEAATPSRSVELSIKPQLQIRYLD